MKVPSTERRGWKDKEDQITPVWFLVEQLPPYLSQKRRIKAKDGYIGIVKNRRKI